MKEIGLYEAKSKLSALVAELEAHGEVVAITRHGRIVAELHPHRARPVPQRGCLKSPSFFISADFDDTESGFEDFFGDPGLSSRIAEEETPYIVRSPSSPS